MKRLPISLAITLPFVQVAVWLRLILIPAALYALRLAAMSHGPRGTHIVNGNFEVWIPHGHFIRFALQSVAMQHSSLIVAMNIPAVLLEVLISAPLSWPAVWYPVGFTVEAWRAFTFPLLCFPAWLFVGRGFEAVLGWRRSHWTALLTGTFLCVALLILLIGLCVARSESERGGIVFPLWGFGLWTLLFVPFPITWVRHWQSSRRTLPSADMTSDESLETT